MNIRPPRWADRFLEWYCRPELLEEIQGDAYELFTRRHHANPFRARAGFVWDVFRFFRWKNIKKRKQDPASSTLTSAMIRNMFLVTLRNFLRHPGQAAWNLVGLSAGFTVAILILLWVAQELSFDRFHRDADRIYHVLTHVKSDLSYQTYDVAANSIDLTSVPDIEQKVSVSTGSRWPHELCFRAEGDPHNCVYLHGVYSNDAFFKVFSFPIVRGSRQPLTRPDEIVISQKMAVALYGTDDAVGKNLKVDGVHDVIVSAVVEDVPATSSLQFDFVMPFSILQKEWGINDEMLGNQFFEVYFKANPTASPAGLSEKLNDVRVLTQAYKDQGLRYEAFPFTEGRLHGKFENGKNTGGRIEYVTLFLIIAALVVIMAVINFINLTTAKASTRAKEIGVRKVTGAHRSTIAVQFMAESFLVVLIAFVLSLILTQVSLPWFNRLLPEPIVLNVYSAWIPFALLGFLMALAALAGFYPALVLSSFQPIRILKGSLTPQTGSNRLRKVLLVVQLSVSLGIIIFSGVLYRQLDFIFSKDLGFDRGSMIRVEPTYKLLKQIDVLKAELAKSPDIVGITTANMNPLQADGANVGVTWPGKAKDTRIAFSTIGVTYEFPQLFGLKLLEGRDFEQKSSDSLNTEVLVTAEAAKLMGMANPVGAKIQIGEASAVIIGVVNDFHTGSLREQRLPVILHRLSIFQTGTMFVKYQRGRTQEGFEAFQKAYKTIEPDYTLKYWFQDDTFDDLYKTERTASYLAILFTVIALIIAIIGIVGLAMFNLARKTREIGVRRVFGASAAQILALLTREFSFVMIVALVVAAPLTYYAASRWLQTFAYHANMPWWMFVIAFILIAVITIGITCLQALRTVKSNPTSALRSE
ncbi:MAG: ABC transporter permease [Verrucomicrobiota bacterium]